MDTRYIRSYIRENLNTSVDVLSKHIKTSTISDFIYNNGYNHKCDQNQTKADFYRWASKNGYITSENGLSYKVVTPSAHLAVDDNVCFISELEPYGSYYSQVNLDKVDIENFERYVENMNQLLSEIEMQAAYVCSNYGPIKDQVLKRRKLVNLNQVTIEAQLRSALPDTLKYSIQKSSVRITVRIEVGDYVVSP